MSSVPLTLVGGYLGSGKTTFINRVLSAAAGFTATDSAGVARHDGTAASGAESTRLRTAVVVNDFGDVNIDAALIESQDADTLTLTNGCICCQITDDVQRTMTGLAARTDLDRVICELSGVGDPAQLGAWRSFPGFRPGPTVICADPLTTPRRLRDPFVSDVVRSQIRAADLVLITKTDLADASQVRATRTACAELAPQAQIETDAGVVLDRMAQNAAAEAAPAAAARSAAPAEAAPGAAARSAAADSPGAGSPGAGSPVSVSTEGADPAGGHAQVHRTRTVEPASAVDVDALHAVLTENAHRLVRAKGFVQDARGEWHELHLAGDRVDIAALEGCPVGASGQGPPAGGQGTGPAGVPVQGLPAQLVLIAAGPGAEAALEETAEAIEQCARPLELDACTGENAQSQDARPRALRFGSESAHM